MAGPDGRSRQGWPGRAAPSRGDSGLARAVTRLAGARTAYRLAGARAGRGLNAQSRATRCSGAALRSTLALPTGRVPGPLLPGAFSLRWPTRLGSALHARLQPSPAAADVALLSSHTHSKGHPAASPSMMRSCRLRSSLFRPTSFPVTDQSEHEQPEAGARCGNETGRLKTNRNKTKTKKKILIRAGT